MQQAGQTIIVFEKNVSQFNLLKQEMNGAVIYHTKSKKAFTEAVKQHPKSILISSYEDAGKESLQLYNECRNIAPEAVFIFIAGSIAVHETVRFMKAGVAYILLREELTDLSTVIPSLLAENNRQQQPGAANMQADISQQKYNSIIDNSLMAFLLSHPNGQILEANTGACKMFGYTIEELRKLGRQGIIDHTDQTVHAHLAERAIKGYMSGEFTGIRKNGEKFPVEYSSVIFTGKDGLAYSSTIIADITERKKTAGYMSLLINNTAEAFVLIDKDLLIGSFNIQFQRLYFHYFGILVKEGQNILDYAQPERKEIVREVYQRVLKGAEEFTEINIAAPGGEQKCFALRYSPAKDLHQTIVGAFVTIADVTEKKKTEEKLAASEKRFRSLVENSADAVVVFTNEGKPLYISPSIKGILGYTDVEALQLDLFSVSHPDDLNTILQLWHQVLNNPGVPIKVQPARFLHKDGSWRWLEKTATNLLHDPAVNGIVDNFRDVTEKVNAEELREFDLINQNALINTTNDLIWSVSNELKLIAANHAFFSHMEKRVAVTLKPGDNIIIDHIFPQEYICFWKKLYHRCLNGEAFMDEMYTPGINNENESWAEVSFNPIYDGTGITGVACYSRDITEFKNYQNQLVEINRKLQTAQQISKLGYWEMDMVSQELFWSDEVYHIWEVTPQTFQVNRSSFYNSIHPEDVKRFAEILELAASRDKGLDVEYRILIPDGSIKHVFQRIEVVTDEAGVPVRYEGTVQDITERKLAELNIQISNERFNLVAKATNDAIWDWNLITNDVVRTGAGLETLFGYNSAEASADNDFWRARVHPEDISALLMSRNQLIAQQSANSWEDEYRFKKANGEYAFVYDKGYIIRDDNGKAIRIIGATQDITHLKETELLLKKLNENLERRAQELQASNKELEQFAYVASHDLQEPLRMVSSFLQLLEKKYKDKLDTTADQYIHFAVDGANRMKKLINDLLEYSRAGTDRDAVAPTNMNEVAEEVRSIFSVRIEEQGAVVTIHPLPVLVFTRKTQMFQLLQNLLGNALKFTGLHKPVITVSSKETSTHWIFSVQDNGIGFEKKYAHKIFTIFQRLQHTNQYTGTGIGLSICKKIVERHYGHIWAESEPGEGSTFFFSIKK